MKKLMRKYFLVAKISLLLCWMGVIFYFSALPGNGVVGFDLLVFLERKGAHVSEYFILTLLMLETLKDKLKNTKQLLFGGGVLSLAYAASDEFHQSFIFGRTSKWSDVGIDAIGIGLALAAYYVYCQRKK